jgi:hypothetical protein
MSERREAMRRRARGAFFCGIVLTLISVSASVQGFGDDKQAEEEQKARKLWEAAVAAKGGREKLRSVHSFYIASEAKSGSRNYDLYIFPDRSLQYSYWAAFERTDIDVYNGRLNVTWWQEGSDPAQRLKDNETAVEHMKRDQMLFLLVTKWLEPKPLRTRKEWIGLKRVDVVETDVDGWRVDYYLDSKTSLPVRVTFGLSYLERAKGKMNRVVDMSDYAAVSGIMLPHKLTYSFTDGPEKSVQQAKYEINVDFDEQIFERPPTPKMTPDSWRRQQKH